METVAETFAVIGYGTQGRVQALNLRDSGAETIIGLRSNSPSINKAENDGFKTFPIDEATKIADNIVLLTPDCAQQDIWIYLIKPHIKSGSALILAHGYSIYQNLITLPSDCDGLLIAPHAIGDEVRNAYLENRGVPAQINVWQNGTGRANDRLLKYCSLQKFDLAGLIKISLKEEVEIDLFAEQAVLVGGLLALINDSFSTLSEQGYNEDSSYLACMYELKAIIEVLIRLGPAGFLNRVSDTALYGAISRGNRVINVKELKVILTEIQNGKFFKEKAKVDPEQLTILSKELINDKIEQLYHKWHDILNR
jgi:ketol-acid reductoisomerase